MSHVTRPNDYIMRGLSEADINQCYSPPSPLATSSYSRRKSLNIRARSNVLSLDISRANMQQGVIILRSS